MFNATVRQSFSRQRLAMRDPRKTFDSADGSADITVTVKINQRFAKLFRWNRIAIPLEALSLRRNAFPIFLAAIATRFFTIRLIAPLGKTRVTPTVEIWDNSCLHVAT